MIMANSINFFANLTDFDNDVNLSYGELDRQNAVEIINVDVITSKPKTKQTAPGGAEKKTRGRKKTVVVVDDGDDDVKECSPVVVVSVPGKGQKTAYKKLEKLKKSISNTINSRARPATSNSATALRADYERMRTRRSKKPPVRHANPDCDAFVENLPVTIANDSIDDDDSSISLKLKWDGRSEVERIQFQMNRRFTYLTTELSKRDKIDPKSIFLMFEHKVIKGSHTPKSIGYTIGKFISVRVIENANISLPMTLKEDSIELKIQSPRWKKPIVLSIVKTDPLIILAEKCAEHLKCSSDTLRFRFDGEVLDMDSTPNELELEGGEILDILIAETK